MAINLSPLEEQLVTCATTLNLRAAGDLTQAGRSALYQLTPTSSHMKEFTLDREVP